jgi:VanZ family protein
MSRRLPKYLLAALLLYWAAMFVATHIPRDALPDPPLSSDKLLHFAAYAALAWLAALALRAARLWNWKTVAAIVVVGAAYAAIDEWLQPYFHRSAEAADWLADMAGIAFGLIVFRFSGPHLVKWHRRRGAATAPPPRAVS